MTARGWFLSVLIGVLVLLGLLARNGNILLLALPLLVYLAAAVATAPARLDVRVQRSISADRTAYGKPIQVQLTAQTAGALLEELHLADRIYPSLVTLEGQSSRVLALPPGGRVEVAYRAQGRRGQYRFEGVSLAANDHFGLFRVQTLVEIPDRLLIYPEIARLRRIDIRPRQTRGFAGPIPARRAGSGVDFFGVREYHVGDSLRHINWRTTARHDDALFTNEFELQSIADVVVILDVREQSDLRTVKGALFDHSVLAATSLAELFLREGHRVGLLIYGHGLTRVVPGYGAVQRERILGALARAETGMSYAFDNLSSLPTRLLPAGSQLVIVSPLLPADLPGLLRVRSLGYALLMVCPDPLDLEIRALPSTTARAGATPVPAPQAGAGGMEVAMRLARVERAVLLGRLRRAGIRVVDWRTTEPLDQVVYTSLARQPVVGWNVGMLKR
jgi:uncharacterized protein (DUF58 family)